jgi:hypothetical protein
MFDKVNTNLSYSSLGKVLRKRILSTLLTKQKEVHQYSEWLFLKVSEFGESE